MKKKFILAFVLCFCFLTLFACAKEPIVAFFTDGTSAGSDNYTVNVDFADDKRFEKKFVDILLSSDTDNLQIVFKREFDEDTTLVLPEKDKWYSLTELLGKQNADNEEGFKPFNDKSDMTLVIQSDQDAFLKMKAVAGDVQENSQAQDILINQVDISKEFVLDLGKNLERE
ncbi:MAG: hypothetical protein ACOX6H_02015 [Christensenellales bacterium]|jgi:hypothetical protein